MNYKPDHQELMAYLYDELDGPSRKRVEQYLMENPSVKEELEGLAGVSNLLGNLKDKEVIAPPLFLPEHELKFWNAPYFKTVLRIAASLIMVILVARFSGTSLSVSSNEFKLSFGTPEKVKPVEPLATRNELTSEQVQQMINRSLQSNNDNLNASWQE